jgi:hypothetical protein
MSNLPPKSQEFEGHFEPDILIPIGLFRAMERVRQSGRRKPQPRNQFVQDAIVRFLPTADEKFAYRPRGHGLKKFRASLLASVVDKVVVLSAQRKAREHDIEFHNKNSIFEECIARKVFAEGIGAGLSDDDMRSATGMPTDADSHRGNDPHDISSSEPDGQSQSGETLHQDGPTPPAVPPPANSGAPAVPASPKQPRSKPRKRRRN